MKITQLVAALQRIQEEHGDLTVAEEKPLAWMAVRYAEVAIVPQYRALRVHPTVVDGEKVVIIKAQ